MTDLAVAVGLVLVIEGVLWASFPDLALRFLAAAAEAPRDVLRWAGAAAAALGVLVIWFVRG